ncbi:MAG: hypothetical protein ICV69_15095 [Thermoleophilaceae bacterium]|nr:hypothetical protein [Thermoleophilaceae bacterium]
MTAKARRANGYVERPLLPSEHARLVEDATRLALSATPRNHCGIGPYGPMDDGA